MTKAEEYMTVVKEVNATTDEMMTALDRAHIQSDQDWENETTTWTFNDGSRIVVRGSDVETK